MKEQKVLVAYFSKDGENYIDGNVVNITVGNTEVVAKMIGELTGGDLFKIEPVAKYPKSYTKCTELAKTELEENARPKMKGNCPDMDAYDVIYLGYPNWWGTMPMVVYTFLESFDSTGKTIYPFCTHEGSGLSLTEHDIERVCETAQVERGLAIQGSKVEESRIRIERWLNR